METDTRLTELLLRWERLREQGQNIAPAEMCRDCPELLEEFTRRARDLEAANSWTVQTIAHQKKATPRGLPTVPGYEILEELGRGGMGVVYKARQVRLDRVVALKMILSGVHAGAGERTRFLTEAQAIARLQHPHIVQVHEIGEHDGYPFFSLEYCGGGSLEKRLGKNP